ncbi:NAD(P)/FAD-dependent oxidoreductase [Mesorhizobium tamadayense]|uniref:Pyridine nucleotide-disulfide oxidoreductase domain-containing protein 2 n=1 Tax=Mesorhizobium tamadayense TaxID=425306 RepID=A0A3P3F6V9_9HYPH|nr:NAD(P)/FAD-dependent oxidoreductase [Mesorhizobium tamadayense]RRH94137.1 NAD(P)/FAD-dependent oxidoreductase [Mesorhizobium tamadayense]
MALKPDYDVIIVGGGHNGLTTAGYLARAGIKTIVLERRGVIGGAAVTEEFHPGFRNSVCSYVVSLLHPKVIRDLELGAHGLKIVERPSSSYLPLPDGGAMVVPGDVDAAVREIAKFSRLDAERFRVFDDQLQIIADVIRGTLLETPPNIGGGVGDLLTLLTSGNRFRKLKPAMQREFIDLMTMSIGDYLNEWFEFDPLKGNLGYESIVGNMVSPYHPGSAYVLIHHALGELNGKKGAWGHAIGGMGSITQAMARSAESKGAEVRVSAGVREVIVERGAARGVVLEDGSVIRARAIAANVGPKLLYLKLIDQSALDSEFLRQIQGWRCRSGSFRMNLALSEMPRFNGLDLATDPKTALSGGIHIAWSLDYLERAYDDAKRGSWSKEPVVSMNIPSLYDGSLAPQGRHVMSVFCQHFHPQLSGGKTWDDVKTEVADLIIATIGKYAPNLKSSILGRQVLTPLDLEREFGLVGGDIFHGALHLDQLYSMRPVGGYAQYRGPIPNLYMCGSGTHPGGGVSGMPGHNAAREIIRDFKRRRMAA